MDLLYSHRLLHVWGGENADNSRFDRGARPLVAEVQVDRAVEALDFVLDEKRHFDMAIFEELVHLLAHNLKIVRVH